MNTSFCVTIMVPSMSAFIKLTVHQCVKLLRVLSGVSLLDLYFSVALISQSLKTQVTDNWPEVQWRNGL